MGLLTNHLHPLRWSSRWSSKCYYKYMSQSTLTWLSWHLCIHASSWTPILCILLEILHSWSIKTYWSNCSKLHTPCRPGWSQSWTPNLPWSYYWLYSVSSWPWLCLLFCSPKMTEKKTSQTKTWLEVHMWSQLDSNGLPEIVALSEVWGISWQLLDYLQAGNLFFTCQDVARRSWSELQTLT